MCPVPPNSQSVTGRHELISASLSQQLTVCILYARGCTAVLTSQSPQLKCCLMQWCPFLLEMSYWSTDTAQNIEHVSNRLCIFACLLGHCRKTRVS